MIELEPKVNQTQEFIEIAFDFSNPLDLVRESISNSFDANAKKLKISFSVEDDDGEKVLKILLEDDGEGMDLDGLQSFFDLGNSSRRIGKSKNSKIIGEKGHGTKVYLNCSELIVETWKNGKTFVATMKQPKKNLHNNKMPKVIVEESDCEELLHGTKITILGYNNNRRNKFTHENVKDYILWFTKMGSIEKVFDINNNEDVVLQLKGVDRDEFEPIKFGHVFPSESTSIDELFDKYRENAPKWYCKKIIKKNQSLKDSPEIKFDLIFCIEGSFIKYDYNKMLKHSGYKAPNDGYSVQERYGLWLCKDYMPIQRKNEWIVKKGSEYTRFHAFVNCQELRLTANRGSIENTPHEIMKDLYECVHAIYEDILESDDWTNIDYLESQTGAVSTVNKEKKNFEKRIAFINKSKVADYKGLKLVEPLQEQGVFSLFMQISQIEKDLFPFEIIDYDTHDGIDVIVKEKGNIPTRNARLYYVEFKNRLQKNFNHSFESLSNIVCWDIDLRHNEEISDIAQQTRILKIIEPGYDGDYTHYFLDDIRRQRKIEIFVLSTYLHEKLGISFRSRNENETYKEK